LDIFLKKLTQNNFESVFFAASIRNMGRLSRVVRTHEKSEEVLILHQAKFEKY
jgi:hypothetical protein